MSKMQKVQQTCQDEIVEMTKMYQNIRPCRMVLSGSALACSTASLWPFKPFWHTTQRRVKFATSVKLPGKPNPLKTPQ